MRYLNNADKSKLLRGYLEEGMALRGILATMEECRFKSKDEIVSVHIVDQRRAIEVLKHLRADRLAEIESSGGKPGSVPKEV
jgi:hypothetical protein